MTRGPGGVRRLPLRTVLCLSAEHCPGARTTTVMNPNATSSPTRNAEKS